jgi:integrase
MSSTRTPKYSRHKASGQAVVHLDGRDIYLGKYKSPVSRAEYDRLIGEWLAAGRRLPTDPNRITVMEVIAAYRKHCQTYYRSHDGTTSKAAVNIDEALKPVVKLYGRTPAAEFGPLRLKAVRETMIEAGRVRTNVNRHVVRIRSAFKWAAENELIPASVYHGLMALSGLRAGRSSAKEAEPVRPVSIDYVSAIQPHVSRQVWTMIQLQLLTGMRPGEVCILRTRDIDTTGALWKYTPEHHKTEHHGISREIFIGPKGQNLLQPFLKLDTAAYCFSPAEAERERREKLRAERKTPLSCGNRPGSKPSKTARRINDSYSVSAYYLAIQRGCDKAFPPPAELLSDGKAAALKAWRADHRWHPNQLRHSRATEVRKQFGIEGAQAVLGHTQLKTTEIYAEKNSETAMKIMAAIG